MKKVSHRRAPLNPANRENRENPAWDEEGFLRGERSLHREHRDNRSRICKMKQDLQDEERLSPTCSS